MMDDRITYGVFWIDKEHPYEWRFFSTWYKNFDDAKSEFHLALENKRCLGAKIVERVETFEDYVAVVGDNYV